MSSKIYFKIFRSHIHFFFAQTKGSNSCCIEPILNCQWRTSNLALCLSSIEWFIKDYVWSLKCHLAEATVHVTSVKMIQKQSQYCSTTGWYWKILHPSVMCAMRHWSRHIITLFIYYYHFVLLFCMYFGTHTHTCWDDDPPNLNSCIGTLAVCSMTKMCCLCWCRKHGHVCIRVPCAKTSPYLLTTTAIPPTDTSDQSQDTTVESPHPTNWASHDTALCLYVIYLHLGLNAKLL